LFASETLLAIGISLLLLFVSSTALLFFGRKNAANETAQLAGKEREGQQGMPLSQKEENKIEKLKERASHPASIQRIIPRDQLEKSKQELRTLLLEREIVSGALTRIYEAEAAKQITKEEKEIIAAKYREELKSLDSRIVGIESFIEVGDLETLRDQLLRLVSEKIEAIEKRIERVKLSASPAIKDILEKNAESSTSDQSKLVRQEKNSVPDISDLLTTSAPRPPPNTELNQPAQTEITEPVVVPPQTSGPQPRQRRNANSDGQVEELQKELLEALDRLEKLDVET
jgi:hypothetical protein